jgi:hypothetical protein
MRATRLTTAPLAAVLAAGALAAPAMARIDPPPDWHPVPPAVTPMHLLKPAALPTTGFDWASGGIGAAAGVGAFAIGLAGAAGLRHRSVSAGSRPSA